MGFVEKRTERAFLGLMQKRFFMENCGGVPNEKRMWAASSGKAEGPDLLCDRKGERCIE